MKLKSLKARLFLIQMLSMTLALVVTGYGLIYLFERHSERRLSAELDTYITQIAAGLVFDGTDTPHMTSKLADPRFEKIFSGLYWQINDETSGKSALSRSLWDTRLILPSDDLGLGKVHIHKLKGPQNSTILVHERRLQFSSATGKQSVRIVVGIDTAELQAMSIQFSYEVLIALVMLGVFLLIAGAVQVTIGLSPLKLVQKSIAEIRNGTSSRIETSMPVEISPLVHEVNDLLAAQEKTLEKAKNRAGDLAHGFKTPLTALKTDVARLRKSGQNKIADDIETTSLIMRRQIERELNKARIRNIKTITPVKVAPTINQIVKTLMRTPDSDNKEFDIACEQHLTVQMDKDDLIEVLGNLLENAVKHARSKISVRVYQEANYTKFMIEDDGKGISDRSRKAAQKRGVRLDETIAGSGLGLAIIGDVLDAYNETLHLNKSSSGGLLVSFEIKHETSGALV